MVIVQRRPATAPGLLGGLLTPPVLLLLAGVVVAVAILLGGSAARVLNGAGALMWVAAAGWMLTVLWRQPNRLAVGLTALAGALLMAVVVRPGTYPEAIVGFFVAGLVVALVANERTGIWALLVPALYFPLHLAVAIGRVVLAGGAREVRTDPPPTEAFVPLAMIVAAALAGAVVGRWNRRRLAAVRR
jgi:hypothetical protein